METWTKEESLVFLHYYDKTEMLWNPAHPSYTCPAAKKMAWAKIAHELDKEVDQLKKKVNNFKSYYARESINTDSAGTCQSSWFAYKIMHKIESQRNACLKHKQSKKVSAPSDNNRPTFVQPKKPQIQFNFDPFDKHSTDFTIKDNETALNSFKMEPKEEAETILEDSDAFGQYVADKLRNLDDEKRVKAQQRIKNVFFEIDKSMY